MIGIYKITNVVNQKAYIGQSINIGRRWTAHKTHYKNDSYSDYNCPLYRAMRKYGIENFKFEIVEQCESEKLNEREKYWISYYRTFNPEKGYNLTAGGQDSANYTILSQQEVDEIVKLLRETSLTQQEIAAQFNITYHTICDINLGNTWKDEQIDYPIRPKYNKKPPRRCQECGAVISSKAQRCHKCQNKRPRSRSNSKTRQSGQMPVTREELKYLIRTQSFVSIGKMFNVSDNAVRKWCKKYNLPFQKFVINRLSDIEWDAI